MIVDTAKLEDKEPREGWKGRYFHSETMTFAYYTAAAGASIHEHAHPEDEVWNVLEGVLEVTIDGETNVLGPGCAAVVTPNTPHSVRVLEDVRTIVVDHPARHSIGGVDLG